MMSRKLSFTVLFAGLLLITAEENKWTFEDCTLKNKSLYDTLWDDNIKIAKETLNTKFLILMVKGSLKAERYMNFTLQDIYYAVNVTQLLNSLASSTETHKDPKKFFIYMNESYTNFTSGLLHDFRFKNYSDLLPSPAMKAYIESYNALMKEDHIYFVVGLLPCAKLWPYIAQHLDISDSSPYIDFKNNNIFDNSRELYEQLLENYRHEINETKANEIFRSHMNHEKSFFAES